MSISDFFSASEGGARHSQFPIFVTIQKGENVEPLTGSNAPLATEIAEARARLAKAQQEQQQTDTETSEDLPVEPGIRDIWQELHDKRARYFNPDSKNSGDPS